MQRQAEQENKSAEASALHKVSESEQNYDSLCAASSVEKDAVF